MHYVALLFHTRVCDFVTLISYAFWCFFFFFLLELPKFLMQSTSESWVDYNSYH